MNETATRITKGLEALDDNRRILEDRGLDYAEEEVPKHFKDDDEEDLIDFGKDLDECTNAIDKMIETLTSIKSDIEHLQYCIEEELEDPDRYADPYDGCGTLNHYDQFGSRAC